MAKKPIDVDRRVPSPALPHGLHRSWKRSIHVTLLPSAKQRRALYDSDVPQEAEERHRQAQWAEEVSMGALTEENPDEEEGGGEGEGDRHAVEQPACRTVLKRLVDNQLFQVCWYVCYVPVI